ncbi:hypothetical protein X798_04266 [Onchocerca flexuosa]|uniref:Uncharacterized protein n=1 Tax=Onchocerca flexuosa TaxID=387005 RepID=A0A238BVW6_9BILA|nr:hypothetical protein X798_04266 [Onchocerca flexuosa]
MRSGEERYGSGTFTRATITKQRSGSKLKFFHPLRNNYPINNNQKSGHHFVSKIPQLSVAFELDEVLLSSEQELMPMNDLQCSDEEASSSSAFSTIITANLGPSARISTERMSSGEPIPCLSVGPYHQRPAPILTENAFVGMIWNQSTSASLHSQ